MPQGSRVVLRAVVAAMAIMLVLVVRLPGPVIAAGETVHIADTLDPAELTVTPGTTVTWVNDATDRHRVRSTSGPTEFDSGDLDPGQTFSVTFRSTGTWQYRDDRNPDLSNYWGKVKVAETPTPSPKPTPTPPPGATPAPVTPPPPTPAPPASDILMAGRAFSPATYTVDAGTTVRWRNNDSREHTVSANDGSFDSGVMRAGATFTKVFNTPGTYRYLCQIHPDMTGTIAVGGAAGATPPPPPKPTPTPKPTPVPTAPPAGSNQVHLVDFAFDPGTLDIVAGTTVTWLNTGAALHTVTASDGSFDSGLMAAGTGRFSRRFATPGTYPYICSLHPSMTGTVRVSGANGATPPPTPKPTPKPTSPPVAAGQLELRDFAFVPSTIRIAPGTRITWVNTGAAPHTVTDRAGSFDSGMLARGDTFSRSFASPGTFQLLCSIHPDMHATLVVAAPGATAPPPATPKPVTTPAPGSGDVAIIDFDYTPSTLQVAVGTTVRWVNQGVAPHTVTAKDGSFDSGFLNTGESFTRAFTEPGVVEYLCAIHPAMIGTVVVGDSGQVPAPSASVAPPAAATILPAPASQAPAAATSQPVAGATGGGAASPAPPVGSAAPRAAAFGAGGAQVAERTQLAVILALGIVAAFIFAGFLAVVMSGRDGR